MVEGMCDNNYIETPEGWHFNVIIANLTKYIIDQTYNTVLPWYKNP